MLSELLPITVLSSALTPFKANESFVMATKQQWLLSEGFVETNMQPLIFKIEPSYV